MTDIFSVHETPERRLERLLDIKAVSRSPDGYAMWCYVCESHVSMVDFVPHHAWFEMCAVIYSDHMRAEHAKPEGE